ncbi:hypothetical protein CLOM_g2466 [Closterium sp. NIES-68]|nr:hypothetical protein CLOM_g2466 [Closterium sp. NIES-68]GJP74346.1 hypothetical protein CLOP_g4940 [Closterium sp. NIES-67]
MQTRSRSKRSLVSISSTEPSDSVSTRKRVTRASPNEQESSAQVAPSIGLQVGSQRYSSQTRRASATNSATAATNATVATNSKNGNATATARNAGNRKATNSAKNSTKPTVAKDDVSASSAAISVPDEVTTNRVTTSRVTTRSRSGSKGENRGATINARRGGNGATASCDAVRMVLSSSSSDDGDSVNHSQRKEVLRCSNTAEQFYSPAENGSKNAFAASEPVQKALFHSPVDPHEEFYSPASDAAFSEEPKKRVHASDAAVSEPSKKHSPVSDAAFSEAPKKQVPASDAAGSGAPKRHSPGSNAAVREAPKEDSPASVAAASEASKKHSPVSDAAVSEAPKRQSPATEATVSGASLKHPPVSDAAVSEALKKHLSAPDAAAAVNSFPIASSSLRTSSKPAANGSVTRVPKGVDHVAGRGSLAPARPPGVNVITLSDDSDSDARPRGGRLRRSRRGAKGEESKRGAKKGFIAAKNKAPVIVIDDSDDEDDNKEDEVEGGEEKNEESQKEKDAEERVGVVGDERLTETRAPAAAAAAPAAAPAAPAAPAAAAAAAVSKALNGVADLRQNGRCQGQKNPMIARASTGTCTEARNRLVTEGNSPVTVAVSGVKAERGAVEVVGGGAKGCDVRGGDTSVGDAKGYADVGTQAIGAAAKDVPGKGDAAANAAGKGDLAAAAAAAAADDDDDEDDEDIEDLFTYGKLRVPAPRPVRPCRPVGILSADGNYDEEMEDFEGTSNNPLSRNPLSPGPSTNPRPNPLSPRAPMSPPHQNPLSPSHKSAAGAAAAGAATADEAASSALSRFRLLNQSKAHRHGPLAFLASEPDPGSGGGSVKASEAKAAAEHGYPAPSSCHPPQSHPMHGMAGHAAAHGQAEGGREWEDDWLGEGSDGGVGEGADNPQLELYQREVSRVRQQQAELARMREQLSEDGLREQVMSACHLASQEQQQQEQPDWTRGQNGNGSHLDGASGAAAAVAPPAAAAPAATPVVAPSAAALAAAAAAAAGIGRSRGSRRRSSGGGSRAARKRELVAAMTEAVVSSQAVVAAFRAVASPPRPPAAVAAMKEGAAAAALSRVAATPSRTKGPSHQGLGFAAFNGAGAGHGNGAAASGAGVGASAAGNAGALQANGRHLAGGGEAGEQGGEGGGERIRLRVTGSLGEHMFRLGKGDNLEKLFVAYANKGGVPVGSLKFVFDGDALKSDSTPADLDLEDEDQIEAVCR